MTYARCLFLEVLSLTALCGFPIRSATACRGEAK
jgi:hypothetical protein